MLRSANCGDLRLSDADSEVTLAGWVGRRRDHGGIIFLDLRDRSGVVQVVFNPDPSTGSGLPPESARTAEELRQEWVVQVQGHVRQRPAGEAKIRLWRPATSK